MAPEPAGLGRVAAPLRTLFDMTDSNLPRRPRAAHRRRRRDRRRDARRSLLRVRPPAGRDQHPAHRGRGAGAAPAPRQGRRDRHLLLQHGVPELGRRARPAGKLGYTNVRKYAEGKQDWQASGLPLVTEMHAGDSDAGVRPSLSPRWPDPSRVLAVLAAVIAATLAGGYLALVSYRQENATSRSAGSACASPPATRARSTSTCRSWTGARASRRSGSPSRLRVDLRTIDRAAAQQVADGGPLDVGAVRTEARDAIAATSRR